MSSWVTHSSKSDPLKPSLIKRAKQRTVSEGKSENVYVVHGNSSLGDHYGSYIVEYLGGETYQCDCQSLNRPGGQYRKTCSHITGVVLHRQEHGEWSGPEEAEDEPGDASESSSLPVNDDGFLNIEPSDTPETNPQVTEAARNQISEDPDPDTPEPEPDEEDVEDLDESEESLDPPDDFLPEIDLDQPWDLDNPALWDLLESPDFMPKPAQVRINTLEPQLPEKFKGFRRPQWNAILEIENALEDGFKVVFVSAPTGSGKTLIAESVRRMRGVRAIYTCTTKTLQDQILSEFDYAKVLKGRSNYPTLDNPTLTALDCTMSRAVLPACKDCPGWEKGSTWDAATDDDALVLEEEEKHCNWCHPVSMCPYRVARREAASARLCVLNTAYFLAETNYTGQNSLFRGRQLVLIDEADTLEEELMRFIEVNITARDRKLIGVGLPEHKTKDESWVVWLTEEVIPAIKKTRGSLDLSPDLFGNPNVQELRKKNKLTQLLKKVQTLVTPIEGTDDYMLNEGWVYTGYEKDYRTGEYPADEKVNVTFKPIEVRDHAREFLWDQAEQFVLLSATLISPSQMAYEMGLEDDEWTVVEVPSSFPVVQRPIIPEGVASVTNKTLNTAIPKLIEATDDILHNHPDDRILVHSVSYRLTRELYYELRKLGHASRLYTYFSAQERENALKGYLSNPRGVLIAPSFDRGVDLPADDCRVIVVAKVPYRAQDKQTKARLYGTGLTGKRWYAVQAIRTLCQMTGRGMRSAEDACRTYILDSQFTQLYHRNRRLFPKWWAEAIVWDKYDPKWRDMA